MIIIFVVLNDPITGNNSVSILLFPWCYSNKGGQRWPRALASSVQFLRAHKNFPKRHRNCQRHQILLVLLFVWSGKGPNQRGLSVYVYLLLCCTRRFSSGVERVLMENTKPSVKGKTNYSEKSNNRNRIQLYVCLFFASFCHVHCECGYWIGYIRISYTTRF